MIVCQDIVCRPSDSHEVVALRFWLEESYIYIYKANIITLSRLLVRTILPAINVIKLSKQVTL